MDVKTWKTIEIFTLEIKISKALHESKVLKKLNKDSFVDCFLRGKVGQFLGIMKKD